jgi:hypothetical protein
VLKGFLLCLMVATVSYWRRRFNIYRVINVWRRMDDQPHRAPRAQSVVVYLCVLCALCGFFSIGLLIKSCPVDPMNPVKRYNLYLVSKFITRSDAES